MQVILKLVIVRVKKREARIWISVLIRPCVPLSGIRGMVNQVILVKVSVGAAVIARKVTGPVVASALTFGVSFASLFTFRLVLMRVVLSPISSC